MKYIGRTIKSTVATADQLVYVEGKPVITELQKFTTVNRISENQINKHFQAIADEGATVIIKSIATEENNYQMELEKFIELATICDVAAEEVETETETI